MVSPDQYRRDPERIKRREKIRKAKIRYGLTLEDLQKQRQRQRNRCAICKSSLLRAHTDHDHATGRFRGILCPLCNWGLGHFRDSPRFLRAAIQYLETTA